MTQNNIRTVLGNNPIVPVVKINHLKEVIPLLDYLKENNFNSIEITLRTACAMDDGYEFYNIDQETNYQQLGQALKEYMTENEKDILMPSVGRIWGERNKKHMKIIAGKSRSFKYSANLLYALKDYCSELRIKTPFYLIRTIHF